MPPKLQKTFPVNSLSVSSFFSMIHQLGKPFIDFRANTKVYRELLILPRAATKKFIWLIKCFLITISVRHEFIRCSHMLVLVFFCVDVCGLFLMILLYYSLDMCVDVGGEHFNFFYIFYLLFLQYN